MNVDTCFALLVYSIISLPFSFALFVVLLCISNIGDNFSLAIYCNQIILNTIDFKALVRHHSDWNVTLVFTFKRQDFSNAFRWRILRRPLEPKVRIECCHFYISLFIGKQWIFNGRIDLIPKHTRYENGSRRSKWVKNHLFNVFFESKCANNPGKSGLFSESSGHPVREEFALANVPKDHGKSGVLRKT